MSKSTDNFEQLSLDPLDSEAEENMKKVENQIKQHKQSSRQEEHQSQNVPTIENSNIVKHISNTQFSQQEELKNEELNKVITVDSLKIFTEDSVQYKSRSGSINLATGYKVEYCLDDENVKALAEYEYALLSGKTVEQSRTEFTLINVADSTVISGWPEDYKVQRIQEIKQAILVGKDMPVFFIVADGLHIVTIGLLPDLNTGVIQIVYMNSAYGVGSDEYILSKMTGLVFLTELAEMITQNDSYLEGSQKLQAQISQVHLNPTQQLGNNCGVITGFNIASLAKYWKHRSGANLDFNEFGNYIGTLSHNILIASKIQKKEQQFEDYIRTKFQAIENFEVGNVPEPIAGLDMNSDVAVVVTTLTEESILQTNLELQIKSEERIRSSTADFSCIGKELLADNSYLEGMICEIILRNRELTVQRQ